MGLSQYSIRLLSMGVLKLLILSRVGYLYGNYTLIEKQNYGQCKQLLYIKVK